MFVSAGRFWSHTKVLLLWPESHA